MLQVLWDLTPCVSGTQVPTFCSPIPPETPEDGGNKLLRNSNTCNNPNCCQDR